MSAGKGSGGVTELLRAWSGGDTSARDELIPLVYEELRRLARAQLRRERSGHTLSTGALINEAYLRMVEQRSIPAAGRVQFFGMAAFLMRRILVDHARAQHAKKRGAEVRRVPMEEARDLGTAPDVDLLAVDRALSELETVDAGLGRVVELRFFAGLTLEETAAALETSRATVARDWSLARAWLRRRLGKR